MSDGPTAFKCPRCGVVIMVDDTSLVNGSCWRAVSPNVWYSLIDCAFRSSAKVEMGC